MTEHEYLKQRVHMLEVTVRNLMAMLIEAQPHLRQQINNMGIAWDNSLDALDAATAAHTATKQDKE